ncbi:MAG TPA: hypothetical protein EYH20_04460 [Leucothrix sp.]|nr:hypothetical protein [Leucothrix sp.]
MELTQEVLIQKGHIAIAGMVLLVYIIRGAMMLAGAAAVNSRSVLAISSVLTVLLFASGVYMGFAKHLSFADGFVLTTIAGFLLFVIFGVIALKQGLPKIIASILWVLGFLAYVYTALIASKIIAPFF